MAEGHPVQLYVYDLSRGLAAQLSPQLLGRQIGGIWHTAIVVYGTEYFFGMGINRSQPGRTYHGPPLRIEELGVTMIPPEVFEEFISQLSAERYRADKYHLLDHNCNTFTAEAAQFLVGRSIPDYIRSLPREFLSTPFGMMMRPYIDAMFSPQGAGIPGAVSVGNNLANSLQGALSQQPASGRATADAPAASQGQAQGTAQDGSTQPFCYEHGSPSQICGKLRAFVGELESVPFELAEAIGRAESLLTACASDKPGEISAAKLRASTADMTGMAAQVLAGVVVRSSRAVRDGAANGTESGVVLAVPKLFPVLDLLRLLALHPPSHAHAAEAFAAAARDLLSRSRADLPEAVRLTALRLGVNVLGAVRDATTRAVVDRTVAAAFGVNASSDSSQTAPTPQLLARLDAAAFVGCAVGSLAGSQEEGAGGTAAASRQAATALAYNIAVVFGNGLDGDAAADLSAALCHVIGKEDDKETVYRALAALVAFGRDPNVAELIGALSPPIDRIRGLSDRHARLCAQYGRLIPQQS